MSTSVTLQELG